MAPVDVNGITKYATEQLHLLYHEVYGLPATAVRLTNVYGPRQRLRDDLQGFLPIFVRRALADEPITVFGDGAQQRDCLYVDDVVECLLLAALAPEAPRRDLQRRERRAPLAAARSPRRSSRLRARVGSSTCRGRPTATPSTSARTSATRRRRSGCSAGSRARRSPTGSRARSRSTGRARSGTCDARRLPDAGPRRRPRPSGGGARARPRRGGRPRRAFGRVPARPRDSTAFEAEFAGVRRAAPRGRRWRRAPMRCAWRWSRSASGRATR